MRATEALLRTFHAVPRLEWFGPYPLAQARPLLDVQGRELVQRVQAEVGLQRELHLVVVRSGQAVLNVPTQRFADSAEYDDGVVASLRPLSRAPAVQMDPGRSFGQPAIRSVRTEVLAEEYRAGATREHLAELYELSPEQVDDALRYEMTMSSQQAA